MSVDILLQWKIVFYDCNIPNAEGLRAIIPKLSEVEGFPRSVYLYLKLLCASRKPDAALSNHMLTKFI